MTTEKNISAHEGLGQLPNALREIWFEIGGSCHLKCSYCFAESGGIDRSCDNVDLARIKGYLDEFLAMGGKRLAIVGAGEPFHPRNIEDTFQILEHLKPNQTKTTIFTTADLIKEETIDRLDNYPDLVLLVKYNSANPAVQDKLVGVNGYTKRREKAMQKLMERGYCDGKRLGLVTSILEENMSEMPEMLRFARDHNLIFDVDTPIPRGRGESCDRAKIAELAMPMIRELSKIDREEYGNVWEPHATYIASPACTRFNQHLYIKKDGTVIPCVGSPGVVLGNVKTQTLAEIWTSPLTQIIRGHKYEGKCLSCKNYQEQKCFSCLGRSTEGLTTKQLQREGCVKTIGCFQYRP